jgi:hypothetical protein
LRGRDSGDLRRRPTSRFLRRSPVGGADRLSARPDRLSARPDRLSARPDRLSARPLDRQLVRISARGLLGGSLRPDDALPLSRFALSG